jgi:hypothetical protein
MKIESIAKGAGGIAAGGALLAGAYALAIRPWHSRWGATRKEADMVLPGDEIVPHPDHQATHAITIDAPPLDVWPWLVQMGQNRGGFYSYAWLENLAGCEIHNAERIIDEWQTIRAGDVLWLHPRENPLPIISVEKNRSLVVGGAVPDEGSDGSTAVYGGTWSFFLEPLDERKTRLIIRIRWRRKPGVKSWLYDYLLLEPAHFVMERKLMLGVKSRAEAQAHQRPPAVVEIEL